MLSLNVAQKLVRCCKEGRYVLEDINNKDMLCEDIQNTGLDQEDAS